MWRHPTLARGGWEDTGQSLALFGLLQQQREDLAPQAQRGPPPCGPPRHLQEWPHHRCLRVADRAGP